MDNLAHSEIRPNQSAKSNLGRQFGLALLNGAILNPLDAVNQLINKTTGSKLNDKLAYNLKPAKFNTVSWYAQTAGTSLGALLPLVLTGKALALGKQMDLTATTSDYAYLDNTGALGLNIKESALTGFTYGALLTPSNRQESSAAFLQQRLNTGISSGLMFSTLTASSLGLSKIAMQPQFSENILGGILSKNSVNSLLSALPSSVVGTEANSLLNSDKLASGKELFQQAYSMSLISLGFGLGHDFGLKATTPKPGEKMEPALKLASMSTLELKPESSLLSESPLQSEPEFQRPNQVLVNIDDRLSQPLNKEITSFALADQNLDQMARSMIENPDRLERFLSLKQTFIESQAKLGDQNIASVLENLNRLISDKQNAYLPENVRLKLAEQILFNANNPSLIDQGKSTTCLTANIEKRVYLKQPHIAIKLLTDIALNGNLVNLEGKTVDIASSGFLEPDIQSAEVLNNPFSPKYLSDIKADNFRNFASQIFQSASVNLYYSKYFDHLDGFNILPNEAIKFIKVKMDPGNPSDTGERVVAKDNNSASQAYRILFASSGLYPQDAVDLYNLLVPSYDASGKSGLGQEKGFVVVGNNTRPFVEKQIESGAVTFIDTPESFSQFLQLAKLKGILPLILNVNPEIDARLFGPRIAENTSHAIMLHDLKTDPTNNPALLKVELSNQWGAGFNFMGKKAVLAAQVFNSLT